MDYERLLSAIEQGEAWAGPALVTVLLPMLDRYAADIGADLGLADREQAIESSILKAIDRLDRYDRDRASFPTWVRGFLRHAISDIRRGRGLVTESLVDDVPEPSVMDEAPTSEHDLTWALLQLKVVDQVIIALRDFEQLTYAQCADRIGGGVTAAACRVRHHRAVKRLGEILASDSKYEHLRGAPENA